MKMTIEPLRKKVIMVRKRNGIEMIPNGMVRVKDVRGAVEWLKINIVGRGYWTKNQMLQMLDEAFPDLKEK